MTQWLDSLLREEKTLDRLEATLPLVALTFDDGPHPEHTPRLLAALAQAGMQATFFVKGCFARDYPDLVRRMLHEGHEVGNHTIAHPDLDRLGSEEEVRAEIVGAQEILREITGCVPVWFRAPCGRHDARVWRILRELSLPSVLMSVGSGDWDRQKATKDSVRENSLRGIRAGDIVLLHEWAVPTVEALPEILEGLRQRGLRTVTLGGLLGPAEQAAGTA